MGFPEIGPARFSNIEAVIGPGGLRIERDRSFRPTMTLQGYAEKSRREGRETVLSRPVDAAPHARALAQRGEIADGLLPVAH